jgi:hypothetical protein
MYYAEIIPAGEKLRALSEAHDPTRLVVRQMFRTITEAKESVTKRLLEKPQDVHEVVILKCRETKANKIHGYYNWTGEQLKLNKGIDPFIHNVLYGRT